jgi:formate dehydrogenase subunit gamma
MLLFYAQVFEASQRFYFDLVRPLRPYSSRGHSGSFVMSVSSSGGAADRQDNAIAEAIEAHRACEGPLLPVLHAIQDRLGYIPREAIAAVAHALNLSRADVHGVISFYHDFRTEPPGRHTVRLCQAEACQSVGSDALAAYARARLRVDFHQTSADGVFTLEPVYCLGGCACSPTMMLDGRLYGRVTPERFDRLVAALEQGK